MCAIVNIEVDVNNLWKTQHPFKVYSAEYMQGVGEKEGEFYKGFVIKMRVNPQDVRDGFRFRASVLNETTVIVTAPALDFHDAGGDEQSETAAHALKPDPRNDNEVIWEALMNGRLEFKNLNIANKMEYHLRFNGGVQLSSEVLLVHAGKLDYMTLEALNVSVEKAPVPLVDEHGNFVTTPDGYRVATVDKFFVGSLLWRVADVSNATRKLALAHQPGAATDGFEAMFGNLNIGNP
jgi:hypothetical protein